ELHSWVHTCVDLEDSQLVGVTAELQSVGAASGLSDVHDSLERVREGIYKARQRSFAAQPAAPSPVAPAAPPPASGGTVAATVSPPTLRRVLIIGASSIQFDLGIALEQQLEERGVVVKRYGRAATGLTQPEIVDWPAKLETLLDAFPADAVLINFG